MKTNKLSFWSKTVVLSLAVMAVSSNVVYGQSMNYDVHIGMNTTKYMSNDDPRMYGQSAKTGMELGFGARYTMKSGLELSSGVNLTMSSCSFSAFSDYIIGNQITTMYPQVNMRNVAIDIPVTLGYQIKVCDGVQLTPMVGVYGRYGLFSIKDDLLITDNPTIEKWNCYKDYQYGDATLSAARRAEFGLASAVRLTVCNHYELSLTYRRGLTTQLPQYDGKLHSLSLTLGYRF